MVVAVVEAAQALELVVLVFVGQRAGRYPLGGGPLGLMFEVLVGFCTGSAAGFAAVIL